MEQQQSLCEVPCMVMTGTPRPKESDEAIQQAAAERLAVDVMKWMGRDAQNHTLAEVAEDLKEAAEQVITLAEWIAEGERLFGKDPLDWKFQCPICKNIQGPEDFRQYIDRGATPETAAKECIGRYRRGQPTPIRKAFGNNPPGTPNSPCDFASFGLFSVGCLQVDSGSGHPTHVFPFAQE